MNHNLMPFLGRAAEMSRLQRLLTGRHGALGVLWGRRRVGKSRLLLEWCARTGGLYTVGEQSAPPVQRAYLAQALEGVFPGFSDVTYPDWTSLLHRLSDAAKMKSWRGPVVFDEFPYWVVEDRSLPSVMQKWIDTRAKDAGLAVVIAGSSQRMMQGLVLDGTAPLYGRAREAFALQPLSVGWVSEALGLRNPIAGMAAFAAWGGIPRYWELAKPFGPDIENAILELVLDPQGILHHEPERLLMEEIPPSPGVRPVLDAIGFGAHRLSEIAGRVGLPATSLSHPLTRLQELGLVRREQPFGHSEKTGKKSLYRISDPFSRLWFRVVAPHRGELVRGTRSGRLALLRNHWNSLLAETWEETCRDAVCRLPSETSVGALGPWQPAARIWTREAEWDIVSVSADRQRLLLGEAKWMSKAMGEQDRKRIRDDLAAKGAPIIPGYERLEVVRAIFVPTSRGMGTDDYLVTAADILSAER